jgi:hypothetical protein
MKTFSKIVLALIIITSTLVSSCGKYEEGPKFSLASKKSRLEGEWKLEKYMVNDADQTAAIQMIIGANFTWEIEKDGKYTQTGTTSDSGTWTLGEDKDDIMFTSSAPGSTVDTYRILRLKSKEFWMKQTQSNGDVYEIHLKQ